MEKARHPWHTSQFESGFYSEVCDLHTDAHTYTRAESSELNKLSLLQCHHLVEAKEDVIENWWFKHYAKSINTDLNSYLCVSHMKGSYCSLPKN